MASDGSWRWVAARAALVGLLAGAAGPAMAQGGGGVVPAGGGAMPEAALFLALGAAALLLNGLFVLAQTAVAAIGPFALEQLRDDRSLSTAAVRRYLGNLPSLEQKYASAALLTLLLLCFFVTRAGVLLIPNAPIAGAVSGIVVALLLNVLVVEVYGRTWALSAPLRTLKWSVPLAQLFSLPFLIFLYPAQKLLPGRAPSAGAVALADMHLRLLPSLGGVERVMEEETFDLIDSVRAFAEMKASEIMTPRIEVEAIPRTMAAAAVLAKMRESGFSRLAVYEGTLDHVVGVLLVKEVQLRQPDDPFSLLRPPVFASETTRLSELLALIRLKQTHLVFLMDEFGGMSGIVTLHDLFETIVGHIDEIDDEDEFWIEKQADGSYLLNGRVELWELNEELGLKLNEEAARTISGLVFHTLGRMARVADEVVLGGARLRVEEMMDHRIMVVRLALEAPAAADPGGEAAS